LEGEEQERSILQFEQLDPVRGGANDAVRAQENTETWELEVSQQD